MSVRHRQTNLSATDETKKTDKYSMSRKSETHACFPLKIDRQEDTLLSCCAQVVRFNMCASVCVGCSSYPCLSQGLTSERTNYAYDYFLFRAF